MRPLLLFLLALLVFSPSLEAKKPKKPKEPKEPPPRAEQFLVPAKDSPAFKHYKQRSKNEISKLLYLLERFHNTEFKVIYDGKMKENVDLVNGDIVVVPTTIWGGISDFLADIINPASHAARVAAVTVL